jgi:hypothetical protein
VTCARECLACVRGSGCVARQQSVRMPVSSRRARAGPQVTPVTDGNADAVLAAARAASAADPNGDTAAHGSPVVPAPQHLAPPISAAGHHPADAAEDEEAGGEHDASEEPLLGASAPSSSWLAECGGPVRLGGHVVQLASAQRLLWTLPSEDGGQVRRHRMDTQAGAGASRAGVVVLWRKGCELRCRRGASAGPPVLLCAGGQGSVGRAQAGCGDARAGGSQCGAGGRLGRRGSRWGRGCAGGAGRAGRGCH